MHTEIRSVVARDYDGEGVDIMSTEEFGVMEMFYVLVVMVTT